MASYIRLVTGGGSGDYTDYTDVVSFTFERERYRAFTVFEGVAVGECDPSVVREVRFYLDGRLMHRGTADSLVSERRGRVQQIRVKSCGFTLSLGENELEPGIVTNATLLKLVQRSRTSTSDFSIQTGTPEVNYIYVKEHTTLWQAMCVYTAKAYNSYPFIRDQNLVMCRLTAPTTYIFVNEKITEASRGVKLSSLISDAYTVDNSDEWTISRTDSYARERHIARQRYYARDLEWAYDPSAGLKYHMGKAAAGRQYQQFTYQGFKGEQLCDLAYFSGGGVSIGGKQIDLIRIAGSEKGVFTTVRCYSDIYCG